ncbi:hypothetical protein HDU76_006483, partial [Blyttiomyces sp. JEL0837]
SSIPIPPTTASKPSPISTSDYTSTSSSSSSASTSQYTTLTITPATTTSSNTTLPIEITQAPSTNDSIAAYWFEDLLISLVTTTNNTNTTAPSRRDDTDTTKKYVPLSRLVHPTTYTTYLNQTTNQIIVKITGSKTTFTLPVGYVPQYVYLRKVIAVRNGTFYIHDGDTLPGTRERPLIIYPDRTPAKIRQSKALATSKNDTVPAAEVPDGKTLSYPAILSEEFLNKWGYDAIAYYDSVGRAKASVDECNADPNCVSPSVVAAQQL